MYERNCDVNQIEFSKEDEVISFKCELQENLQKAMKEFLRNILTGINTG